MMDRFDELCAATGTAIVALSLLGSSSAIAQGDDQRGLARELFDEAIAAGDRGELPRAIEALEESFELFPHPGTLLNLALFRDRAGCLVAARETYGALFERYGTVISAETAARARERLEAIEAQLASITITTSPAGAALRVDGLGVGASPRAAPLWLDPGRHTVEARLEGFEPARVEHDLDPGQRLAVALSLVERPDERALLVVESGTPGARAALDDGPLEPLPLRRRLDPGEVTLRVVAEGFEPAEPRPLEIPEGGELRLSVELRPLGGSAEASRGRRFWRGPWPWVIGGSLAAIALGVGLGVGLSDDEPQWTVRTP